MESNMQGDLAFGPPLTYIGDKLIGNRVEGYAANGSESSFLRMESVV